MSLEDNVMYAIKRVNELEKENKILKSAIGSVVELIDESVGVVGLHRNEDVAEWRELLEGGHLEEWLMEYSKAVDFLNDVK